MNKEKNYRDFSPDDELHQDGLPAKDDQVMKLANDYTGGRTGVVVDAKGERRRVHWTKEKSGERANVRTWCNVRCLKIIDV